MTFTVTYRDQMGAKREEAVEAADRGACVAACRARGISPIAIRESKGLKGVTGIIKADKGDNGLKGVNGVNGLKGVNGDGRRGAPHSIPHSHNSIFSHFHISTFLLVLALLAILGGAAWWWFGVHGTPVQPSDAPAKPRGMPKDVTPAIPKRPTSVAMNAQPAEAVAKAPQTPAKKPIQARSMRSGRVMTLADGTVVTNTPRVFFKRDFERALHVALMPTGMGGTLLRQIRARYTDEQILAMLRERIRPEPGDDATTVAVKEKVQNFKEQVLEVIGQGSSVAEVLDGMTRRKVEDGLLRANALKIRTEALRSGNPEAGRQGIEAANAILEENGLRKMDVPRSLRPGKPEGEGVSSDTAERNSAENPNEALNNNEGEPK